MEEKIVNASVVPSKKLGFGAPGWLSCLSVRILILAQVVISVYEFEPHIGLCADSVEPAWDSLSLSSSLPLPCSLSFPVSLSLSLFSSLKTNKHLKQKEMFYKI